MPELACYRKTRKIQKVFRVRQEKLVENSVCFWYGAIENIVFLELKRRGYDVYIGKNDTKEIDFVAIRREERIYVQVCVQIPENSDREVANLMEIKDHYPKYVVTLNSMDTGIENGIRIVHLADFLQAENW